MDKNFRVAIVGGGPSALFLLQAAIQDASSRYEFEIFEAGDQIGAGMPYSRAGANNEHVTNVSGNELPSLPTSLLDWLRTLSGDTLRMHGVDPDRLSEFKVVPRLLFGKYLQAQFDCLFARANERGMSVSCHLNTRVIDVEDSPHALGVILHILDREERKFDCVILCTGHVWLRSHEGEHPGYFDSPYPPSGTSP
ncbi:FAD/NAD(P)-binding protein [Anatilimnocola floriformis]|uniref:FAD/NAD(P)-binding protein n=1 Tax=Anatilimnocola floriformis TaxID=2948575 RepID=UPI0020C22B42|nr:FAD/NAD(P)-binding protein [Anatilimnocola floriformis]